MTSRDGHTACEELLAETLQVRHVRSAQTSCGLRLDEAGQESSLGNIVALACAWQETLSDKQDPGQVALPGASVAFVEIWCCSFSMMKTRLAGYTKVHTWDLQSSTAQEWWSFAANVVSIKLTSSVHIQAFEKIILLSLLEAWSTFAQKTQWKL